MTPGARVAAAIEILDQILAGAPAERMLTAWARGSRFAGSKDRAAVRDHVFDVLRAMRSLAARGGAMTGRALMIGLAARDGLDLDTLFHGEGHAPARLSAAESEQIVTLPMMSDDMQYDIPEWLWPGWLESLGDAAIAAAVAQQHRAPVYLRVNLRRGSVDAAIARLAQDEILAEPHASVAGCIRVLSNERRIKMSAAYLAGLVELQDAASQYAVGRIAAGPGDRVLDYCAGGGGKALAFADMPGVAVAAHDVAPHRMKDLPARAARAGVEIALLTPDQLPDHAPFDVVFCDAPCSGSGTWRRTPDAKWRLTDEELATLNATQLQVLLQAATFVGAQGTLAYATCSVLQSENDGIVDKFLEINPAWAVTARHVLLPGADGDGFFLCLLKHSLINL